MAATHENTLRDILHTLNNGEALPSDRMNAAAKLANDALQQRPPKTLAQAIADALLWRGNLEDPSCNESQKSWRPRVDTLIDKLENELPRGSGIDNGTKINREKSTSDKLILEAGYHHMNEAGYYDGWTEHTITVRPTFGGISVRISGPNRNDIKEYLHGVYECALSAPAPDLQA